jgi:large subunit ribosomal protein L22
MIKTKISHSNQAVGKFIRMSPIKIQRVLRQIAGCSYEEALILLKFLPYRACQPVSKVLKSAASNAINNAQISKENLIVHQAIVGRGPILKRSRPRAKGRIFQILKYTSHIRIILKDKTTQK